MNMITTEHSFVHLSTAQGKVDYAGPVSCRALLETHLCDTTALLSADNLAHLGSSWHGNFPRPTLFEAGGMDIPHPTFLGARWDGFSCGAFMTPFF